MSRVSSFVRDLRVGACARGAEARSATAELARPPSEARRPHNPPALTGGESTPGPIKTHAKPDWLTYTFQIDPQRKHYLEHLDFLRSALGRNVTAQVGTGILGYAHGIRFFVRVDNEEVPIARLDWGGSGNKANRARFDLSGKGCSAVLNWHAFSSFVASHFAYTLTRIDLACDLLDGQYTVEDCASWYSAGDFNAGGRMPRHSLVGDWLSPHHGRTFEVGRRANGKMLRAYEKGRQLGDPSSLWTRFEIEFRNIDRDLSLDMLIDCDRYFVGAYKCLERVIASAPQKVPTHQREGEISLQKLIHHAREAYGKCIHVMRLHMSDADTLSFLTVNGVPARLEKAAVAGFFDKDFLQRERTRNANERYRL